MKSIIVTGASSGIGRDLVLSLANRGHQVFAGVRSDKDFQELTAVNKHLVPVVMDVTSEASIQKALEFIGPLINGSVCLVNNAGIAVPGPLEAIELKQFEQQFQVNVFGLVRVTQAFLPMIRKTQGRIVNISSVSGLSTSPFLGAYAASKYAVESLSDALRRELHPFGVKVIVVEPGPIQTPIWSKGLANKDVTEQGFRQDIYPIYRESFRKFEDVVKQISAKALPVKSVTEKVIVAIDEQDPPARILIASFVSWLGTRLSQKLPDQWVDVMIRSSVLRKR